MKSMFLRIWKDPVWSKVISVGIIALIGLIYSWIKDNNKNVPLADRLYNFINIQLPLWLFFITLLFLLLLPIILKAFKTNEKKQTEKTYTDAQINHDRKLFKKIKESIPGNGSIQFIRTNNFAGNSFDWNELNDFDFILENFDDPDLRFINSDLEDLRAELFKKTKTYRYYLASKAFTIGENRRASVPPEWEQDRPEVFWEVVNILHDSAGEICEIYDKFILKGKHAYGI